MLALINPRARTLRRRRAARAGRRRDGGRGLRPDSAGGGARHPAPGRNQYSCFAAAALARRGADPARHPRRRRATGISIMQMDPGWIPARCCRRVVADRSRGHRREPARQAGRARRAPDRDRARRLERGPLRARRRRKTARATPRRSTKAEAGSTGPSPPCYRAQGARVQSAARTTARCEAPAENLARARGRAPRVPGTIIVAAAEGIVVACASGSVRGWNLAARRRQETVGARVPRGFPLAVGERLRIFRNRLNI